MITLLIPTMNRSEFLLRLIRYYHDQKFKGSLFIGDSSGPEHLERTRAAISRYSGRLHIVHREYPGFNNAQCMKAMLAEVSTPYGSFLGDDDFLTVGGLQQCVAFLDANSDYCAAHGKGIVFSLEQPGVYGKIFRTSYYRQIELLEETPSLRLIRFLRKAGVTLFSVFRIGTMRRMYAHVNRVKDMSLTTEVLPCCLSAIAGKNKELNCLSLFRQVHNQQYIYVPDTFDWITSAQWAPAYTVCRDIMADELVDREDLAPAVAREIVKLAYSYNLIKILDSKWRAKYRRYMDLPARLKLVVDWLKCAGLSLAHRSFSLPELVKPTSRYQDDFMPVFDMLAGTDE